MGVNFAGFLQGLADQYKNFNQTKLAEYRKATDAAIAQQAQHRAPIRPNPEHDDFLNEGAECDVYKIDDSHCAKVYADADELEAKVQALHAADDKVCASALVPFKAINKDAGILVQELAKGKATDEMSKTETESVTKDQLLTFLNNLDQLFKLKVSIDSSEGNIFYDKEAGFSVIDYVYDPSLEDKSKETIVEELQTDLIDEMQSSESLRTEFEAAKQEFLKSDAEQIRGLLEGEFTNYLASKWHSPTESPKYPKSQEKVRELLAAFQARSLITREIPVIYDRARKDIDERIAKQDPDYEKDRGGVKFFHQASTVKRVIEALTSESQESALWEIKNGSLGRTDGINYEEFLARLIKFSRQDHSVQGIMERAISELKTKFLQQFKKQDGYEELFKKERNEEDGIERKRRDFAARFLTSYPHDFSRVTKLFAFIIQENPSD